MKTQLQIRHCGGRGQSAFTMIEIALCIAIVGFALVAILGVMPTGMTVQKDNREDTIISQDGQFFLETIRNGLTNNVSDISSNLVWIELLRNGVPVTSPPLLYQTNQNGTNLITSRAIVGYMSTPKYEPGTTNILALRARFLANSGDQAVKALNTRDLAFSYVLRSEVVPFNNFLPATTNVLYATNLSAGLYDVRVTLQWPVYGATNVGPSRRVFRTLVSGGLRQETNSSQGAFYFFEPATYQPGY